MLLCHITQDTVLISISAAVLFSLAVSLATIIDAHAAQAYHRDISDYDYDRFYPSTVPAKAAAVSVKLSQMTACM